MARTTFVEEQQIIIFNYEKGKSVRENSCLVNRYKSTVANVINRCMHENRFDFKVSTNRPKILIDHV